MSSIGFKFPFTQSTGSLGYFETSKTEVEAVGQNLRALILTNWGERVNHYDLGCNLVEFLFENFSDVDLRERISDRIISQVSKWMPFVNVVDLRVLFSDDDPSIPDHGVGVRIKFSLASRPDIAEVLEIPVSA